MQLGMSGNVQNLRTRLQELHELHATGFVDDAQYAESRALLERWIVDAVMSEAQAEPGLGELPERADDAPPAARMPTSAPPRSTGRWPIWLGAAALAHGVVLGVYWWSTTADSGDGAAAHSKATAARATGIALPSSRSASGQALGAAPAAATDSAPLGTTSADAAAASQPADTRAQDPAASATIGGTVALSAALAKRVRSTDTVFVYARAVDGPPMPLAVIRRQVKDLPLSFVFDDSMAMWPTAKVSAFARVVVTARVSRSGEGKPQAGDLEGHSPAVPAGTSGLLIDIASVVGAPATGEPPPSAAR